MTPKTKFAIFGMIPVVILAIIGEITRNLLVYSGMFLLFAVFFIVWGSW